MPGAFHPDSSGSRRLLLEAREAPRNSFGLLGIPHDAATTIGNPGARFAPALLREMLGDWLARRVQDSRLADVDEGVIDLTATEIVDFGDVELSYADTAATLSEVNAAVAEVFEAGLFRLVRGVAPHLAAIDIAELNPLFDQRSNATAVIAARVILDFVTTRARAR